jgi:hypothetical protein
MIMVGNGKVGTQPTSTDAALPANTVLAVQPSMSASASSGTGTNGAAAAGSSRAAAGKVIGVSWGGVVGVVVGIMGVVAGAVSI